MLLIELVMVVIALVLVVKGKVSSTCWVSVKESKQVVIGLRGGKIMSRESRFTENKYGYKK